MSVLNVSTARLQPGGFIALPIPGALPQAVLTVHAIVTRSNEPRLKPSAPRRYPDTSV
jgi:hypothetical protein